MHQVVRSLLIAVFVLASITTGFAQQRMSGGVRTPDRPERRSIDVYQIDGVHYLDVREVARLFHATKYWNGDLEKMVLKVKGHRVRLTVGSPYVFVDNRGTNLLAPVLWGDGRLLVPVTLATEVLDELIPESVTWRAAARHLRFDTGDPNITGVEYDDRKNGTVVEIRLLEPLRGKIEYPRPDRLVVRVPGGVMVNRALGTSPGVGLIDSCRATQKPGEAEMTFYLSVDASAQLLTRAAPPRLVIAVSEGAPDDIPLPEFEGRDSAGFSIDTIVLDAGHGGSDSGIRSENGVAEKDVTLAIALKLRDLLRERQGLRVVMTREDDSYRSVQARAELANRKRGAAFVSLHGNGWFDPSVRGFSVGIHRLEDPTKLGTLDSWGSSDPLRVQRSEMLAETVAERLEGSLSAPNRGVKFADYAVLEGASMPGVLIECGYLTNGKDANDLADPDVQRKIAGGIAAAIAEFREAVSNGGGGGP